MFRVPDPVYREHLAPRITAPAAELLLDALPEMPPKSIVVELEPGIDLMGEALSEWAKKSQSELRSFTSTAQKADPTSTPFGELPFESASTDLVIANGVFPNRITLQKALPEIKRILSPTGHLVLTCFLSGSFDQLLDLLIEAAESKGDVHISTALTKARAGSPTKAAMKRTLTRGGFSLDHFGVEERALFPKGSVSADPLFTEILPTMWFKNVPTLPWDDVSEAIEMYFEAETFSVAIVTGIVGATLL